MAMGDESCLVHGPMIGASVHLGDPEGISVREKYYTLLLVIALAVYGPCCYTYYGKNLLMLIN